MFLNVEKEDEEITADILSNLPSKYQKSVGFFAWDYARAIAIGGFQAIYKILKYICSMGDINNFEYDDLVKFVYQRRGIIAHEATYARGSLNITGTGTITEGDLFQTEAGLKFQAIETKEINNSGTVLIQAIEKGSSGCVPANTIVIIPISIAGISSVTNQSALTGGYDKETKEALIERYLEDIRRPITSNNIYHYKKWAKEVTGVGDAKIKPLWNGDNTVKVVIINSNKEPADNALIKAVQDYIDPYTLINNEKVGWGCGLGEADIGAYVTVSSASAKNIDVSAGITLKEGATLQNAIESIRDNIKGYFKSVVFNEAYVSYAKIGACILQANEVLDYNNLTVNSGVNNILLADTNITTEIPILNTLTIT